MTMTVRMNKLSLIGMVAGVVFIPTAVLGALFLVQTLLH